MDAARIRFRTGHVGAKDVFRIYQTPGDWTNMVVTVDPSKAGPQEVRNIVRDALKDIEDPIVDIIVGRINSRS